jgi:hypothetical protein
MKRVSYCVVRMDTFSCFEGACSDQKCSRWNGYCSRSFEASKNSTRQRKTTGSTVLIIKNKKKEAPEFERRSTIEKPCNTRLNRLVDREARDFRSGLELLNLGR